VGLGNILLSSAGRRTSLLKALRAAAHARGVRAFAADCDALAPALYLADEAFLLPRIRDEEFVPRLLDLIARQNIALVVPTIDTELPVLADLAQTGAAGACVLLVSSPEVIALSGDKWLMGEFFRARGVRTPRSWLPEQALTAALPERIFLKPRDGSASQHAYAARRDELEHVLPRVPNAIVQERLEGREITIDALLDLAGRPIHLVPRVRIKTVGGESIQGVTLDDAELRPWLIGVLELLAAAGARGPLTLQAFATPEGPVLSEVNPRFGGGFPLTQAAGGRYPEWLLSMLAGEPVEPCFGRYEKGLYMTRYYVEHFTRELK
jgi:carbamoyl-phosphate synthase large subunit